MAIPHALVSKTTRSSGGLTNIPVGQTLSNYVCPDYTRVHEYFDDFDQATDITIASPIGWTLTKTGTGAITIKTGVSGGRINVATTNSSGDSTEAQCKSDGYVFTAGKRLMLKYKIQCDNVSTTDIVIGLQKINTAPLTATDGIYFVKATGAATIVAKVVGSSTASTSGTLATMVVNTDITLGLEYNPFNADSATIGTMGTIDLYINDSQVGSVPVVNAPSANLAPVIFLQTNSANARNLQVDYIFQALER